MTSVGAHRFGLLCYRQWETTEIIGQRSAMIRALCQHFRVWFGFWKDWKEKGQLRHFYNPGGKNRRIRTKTLLPPERDFRDWSKRGSVDAPRRQWGAWMAWPERQERNRTKGCCQNNGRKEGRGGSFLILWKIPSRDGWCPHMNSRRDFEQG